MQSNLFRKVTLLTLLASAPTIAAADGGFFLAGSVGAATLNGDFAGLGIDARSTAYRLTTGVQLSDALAFEVGYHDFGKFEDTQDIGAFRRNRSVEADGFTIGATLAIPLGRTTSLFGRAGAFFWDGDAAINNLSLTRSEDNNLYYGGGAEVQMAERLFLVGDWTRYDLVDTSSDVMSIGFRYRF